MEDRKLRLHDDDLTDEEIMAYLPGKIRATDVMEALDVDDDDLREIIENGELQFVLLKGVPLFDPREIGAFILRSNGQKSDRW